MNYFKFVPSAMILLFLSVILSSCSFFDKKDDTAGQEPVDFTVVEEEDLPQELSTIIAEKKETGFKLTYSCNGYLYIVQGYGMQNTGGYSISVDNVYETDNAVYFDTTLMGPEKDEKVVNAVTYPYVVVKIENKEKSVVFLS